MSCCTIYVYMSIFLLFLFYILVFKCSLEDRWSTVYFRRREMIVTSVRYVASKSKQSSNEVVNHRGIRMHEFTYTFAVAPHLLYVSIALEWRIFASCILPVSRKKRAANSLPKASSLTNRCSLALHIALS